MLPTLSDEYIRDVLSYFFNDHTVYSKLTIEAALMADIQIGQGCDGRRLPFFPNLSTLILCMGFPFALMMAAISACKKQRRG
jgi:hypothetical protein